VETLGAGRRLDPRPLLRLARHVRSFAPDIVHTWRPWGNLLGRWAAAVSSPAALIATAHSPHETPEGWHAWLQGRLHRRTARWVAPCPSLADQWAARGVPREKLVVIPPAVALENGSHDGAAVRQGLRLPPAARLIVCAGRLLPRNGIKDAIWTLDILKYLDPNIYLAVAGDGPQRDRLHQFARGIRVADHVRFLGARQDIAALLRAADVVWVPGQVDDVPLVALEAMAVGRPVVASRLSGIAAAVIDGATGFLVPPGDKPALARQTRLLLEDAQLRQRLGEAGRKHVAQHFLPEQMVERHLALYRQVLAERS
jgi:glycosyltransferase involved in cell wall biosynthesis